MRPQQQNRRMRGRGGSNNNSNNNNRDSNRKGPNPLTRSYESNGPDVKIRGTAQQVAEKYTTLARDSHSAGDRVMAENYLQHAEHYNRIIFTALAQQQQAQQQQRDNPDDFDNDGDDERSDGDPRHPEPQHQQRPQYHANGTGPQPVIDDASAPPAFEAIAGAPARSPEQQSGDDVQRAEGEEGGGPRRPRRPRRPLRNKPEQADGEEASAEAPTTPEAAE